MMSILKSEMTASYLFEYVQITCFQVRVTNTYFENLIE